MRKTGWGRDAITLLKIQYCIKKAAPIPCEWIDAALFCYDALRNRTLVIRAGQEFEKVAVGR